MPTQRFLKLRDEKKQAILAAAVHEFSRVPYSLASINQIIKEAGISRGSFYTYFDDKDDLMQYVFRGFRDGYQEKVMEVLSEEGGNPFAVPVRLLCAVMEEGESGLGYRMFKNMLSDLNTVNQNRLLGIRGAWFRDEAYQAFSRRLYNGIDREAYPVVEELMPYLMEMFTVILARALSLYYINAAEKEQLLEILEKELAILEKGVCRQ